MSWTNKQLKSCRFSSSLAALIQRYSEKPKFLGKIIKKKTRRESRVGIDRVVSERVYKTRKKCVKIFSLISEIRFNWTKAKSVSR